ncbi:MAG: GAF domain-containing protein [Betaproteobacteria bacterium]|nr:GAF domain-containing protein [Betaproteobacteria bacterium]MBK7515179.1 GAF domain-containing protein [Betaproteobacteria bacterium]MBK8865681.1 GAF domain-containing protein [Betaproteobacteria bacterium]MBK9685712.1 GAF domain-containing protein [Betaproteobacteria bacterium]
MSSSPAFGQADLTNCERELIHLAGSIQPHGLLLVVREPGWRIVQASANAGVLLRRPLDSLLLASLAELGGDLETTLRRLAAAGDLREPQPLRCTLPAADGSARFEGAAHRVGADALVVELEPLAAGTNGADSVPPGNAVLLERVAQAVQRFSEASSVGTLADGVVRCVRDFTGYDRVMVYQFDPDGHGKIIAEARDPRLDSLLGHHYPATDIPQRARELYLRNRVRVLVDVNYEPAPLVPRLLPGGDAQGGAELDMSLSFLRSMSPLHLQYLRNMGVTGTLVVSLVREGRLWGLIACHHYAPRHVSFAVRTATELLAEVIATRIAAIENYARAQVAIQVRRLEQRLIEATSTEGDWRLALVRNPRLLQQPLQATGAALFHEGEVLTCGEVPSTPELRALMQWIDVQAGDSAPFACSAVGRDHPALASVTPTASGVLAVRLSAVRPDYLVWFRKEQLQSVTWAGDPTKPMIDNDPLKLSPRRSFAAWSEIVRGTAAPWTAADLALASAFGDALIDIIVQVNAVRLLIAEHQLSQVRATVADSKEAVVVASAAGDAFYANAAFHRLAEREPDECRTLEALLALFAQPALVRQMMGQVRAEQRAWRGEMALLRPRGEPLPVSVRGEPVPARDGALLGFIFIFNDLSEHKRAEAARLRLESSLSRTGRGQGTPDGSDVLGAIIANASLAAMDIADGGAGPVVAPLLQEVEAAATRAALLYARIRGLGQPQG